MESTENKDGDKMDTNENIQSVSTTVTTTNIQTNISTKVVNLEEIGKLISQGAEAKTFEINLYGLKCIVKERFIKAYRHSILDQKISSKRILQEVRALNKCKKRGVQVPSLYLVDIGNNRIYMELIEGETFKQYLYTNQSNPQFKQTVEDKCKELGKQISIIHGLNLVHGDLTTSNIMIKKENDSSDEQMVFIDFGLSYISAAVEDKAVDLYVLERAFISTHPNSEPLFDIILQGYQENNITNKTIIQKLIQVRLRGRKKTCFG